VICNGDPAALPAAGSLLAYGCGGLLSGKRCEARGLVMELFY